MSGVYLTRHGGPEALEWRENIPMPIPGPGEVLVKVLAAGVNNTDINTREGWYSSDLWGATGDKQEGVEAGGWAGAIAGPMVKADLRRIYLRDIRIHGCTYQSREVFARVVEKINAGQLRPRISKTYPMRDIRQAQADFMAKTHAGKLVLLPPNVAESEGTGL